MIHCFINEFSFPNDSEGGGMLVTSIAESLWPRATPLAVPLWRAEIPSCSSIQSSTECVSRHAVVSEDVRCHTQLMLSVLDRAQRSSR